MYTLKIMKPNLADFNLLNCFLFVFTTILGDILLYNLQFSIMVLLNLSDPGSVSKVGRSISSVG